MKPLDRIALFRSLLETFLLRAKDGGHICFGVLGRSDNYVQFKVLGDGICGEVGSRQWSEPERPLPAAAVEALSQLGFTGGGPEKNYAKSGLPKSAADLSALADQGLRAAYDLDEDFSPVVHEIHLNDVTPPRAEPFTQEMIVDHLRDHGVHFLRDEDGDCRLELEIPEGGGHTVVWLVADGDAKAVYHIHATAPECPGGTTRPEALEACNSWNREHRWPKACVIDRDDGDWRIILAADIDLTPGVTRPLFDRFTEHAVTGILSFWATVAKRAGTSETSAASDADQRPSSDHD